MRAVDLFAGWGGFTLGARQAGLDVVWAANHWPVAVRTHKLNHPETEHLCQDLRQADWTALPQFDILLASPACQGHSTASQPRRRLYHDGLRATALAVVDCADVCRPRAVVVENVPSFRHWQLFDWWCDGLRALGYRVDARLVNAARLGVPQRRTRLFVIATLDDISVPAVEESPNEPGFRHCLGSAPAGSWRKVSQATPNVQARIGQARRRCGKRFLTQHTTGHPGVPLDEPIRTITTVAGHWNLVDGSRYRPLTGRELARGMGFPDTFTWPAGLSAAEVTRGLGNAICPPVAQRVLQCVLDAVT